MNSGTRQTTAFSMAESVKGLARYASRYIGYPIRPEAEAEAEHSSADAIALLNRMLSTRSNISTVPSIAEPSKRQCIQIGQGQCGTIFAFRGTKQVIKLPNSAAKVEFLSQDARVHRLVNEAFHDSPADLRSDISIPEYHTWITPDMEAWWDARAHLFSNDQQRVHGLVSERIFPLMQPVRHAIVDVFCPSQLRKSVLASPETKDCLVRLYLGRRESTKREEEKAFRLRNFPLHINDMETLGLDCEMFARVMADALAILHWRANVDGNDIEFVLGSAPIKHKETDASESAKPSDDSVAHPGGELDFTKRSVRIWLLDFNQCTTFDPSMNIDIWLPLLTKSFWFNDPYYPRPVSTNKSDMHLWKVFSKRYLVAAKRLTSLPGPDAFIQAITEAGLVRPMKVATAGKGSLFGALAGWDTEVHAMIRAGWET